MGLKSRQWHVVALIQLWFPCNQEDLLGFNGTKHIYALNLLRRPDQMRRTGTKIIFMEKFSNAQETDNYLTIYDQFRRKKKP